MRRHYAIVAVLARVGGDYRSAGSDATQMRRHHVIVAVLAGVGVALALLTPSVRAATRITSSTPCGVAARNFPALEAYASQLPARVIVKINQRRSLAPVFIGGLPRSATWQAAKILQDECLTWANWPGSASKVGTVMSYYHYRYH